MQSDYNNNLHYFRYETSDGSLREEAAELKNAGSENEALQVHGSYTYVGTDGVTYKVTYVADENGYRASGQHLPQNAWSLTASSILRLRLSDNFSTKICNVFIMKYTYL